MGTGGKIGKVVSSATWQLRPLPQPQSNSGKGGPHLAGVESRFPWADTAGAEVGHGGASGAHNFPSGTSCPTTTGSCLRAKRGLLTSSRARCGDQGVETETILGSRGRLGCGGWKVGRRACGGHDGERRQKWIV